MSSPVSPRSSARGRLAAARAAAQWRRQGGRSFAILGMEESLVARHHAVADQVRQRDVEQAHAVGVAGLTSRADLERSSRRGSGSPIGAVDRPAPRAPARGPGRRRAGTSRCETTARSDSESIARTCACSFDGKAPMMRSTVRTALPVCSVASTRCPVSAAVSASEMVSRSRSSPITMTSGSSRSAPRSARAKLSVWRPTWRWLTTQRFDVMQVSRSDPRR